MNLGIPVFYDFFEYNYKRDLMKGQILFEITNK